MSRDSREFMLRYVSPCTFKESSLMSRHLYTILGSGLRSFESKRADQNRVVLGQVRLNNITLQAFQRALDRHTTLEVVASRNNSMALPGFIVTLTTDADCVSEEDLEEFVRALPGHVSAVTKARPESVVERVKRQQDARKASERFYLNQPPSIR